MTALFASGHVVDLILLVMAVEAAWMLSRPDARSKAALIDVVLAFAPGICLLLALRASLTGMDWTWTALALAASFPFHILDLRRRRR